MDTGGNALKAIDRESGSPQKDRSAPSLKVWIDFVCPYCFLAEPPLTEATRDLGIDIEWMPFELRPYPQPTLRPEGAYLQTVWRRSVYPLAARMGIPIRLPDVSPQPYSRLALEGLEFAKEHGKSAAYVDAVLRAFFQQSVDIGDPDALETIARSIGLPGDAYRAALQEGRYTQAHRAALENALRLGIRSVPTILIADRRIEGVPDPTVLRQAIQKASSAGPGEQPASHTASRA